MNMARGGAKNVRRQSSRPMDGANSVPVTPRGPTRAGADTPGAVSTPVPSASTPAPQQGQGMQPSLESRESVLPYDYEYVTDEALGAWGDGGRVGLVAAAQTADDLVVGTIFQELVRAGLDERLDPTEAGATVKSIIAERQEAGELNAAIFFLNTISLLDDADSKRPALLTLVIATDIDPQTIRQELDVPLLQSLELVRSTFTRIKTRKATNVLYKQANFNLLREDTEGYAKLLTEYFNTAQEASNPGRGAIPNVAENAFQRIMALVGAFDLDVGRVLDVTLDISANLVVKAYSFFMRFYRCSHWWPDSRVFDSVKWEDDGFTSYPAWALPGSGKVAPSDEDLVEFARLKLARDVRFWARAQKDGMNAFFELGARRITNYEAVAELLDTEILPQLDGRGEEYNEEKRKRIEETRKFMRDTRTLPPPGNPDAAQLLGFKLSYYASTLREASDTMPENLMALVAMLIKIGFISLRDIYGHLYPPDDQMPTERVRLEKEKAEKEAKERPGAGGNALAMAGALPEEGPPSGRHLRVADKERSGATSGGATPLHNNKDDKQDDKKDGGVTPEDKLPHPDNQKLALLKHLLLVGAIPEALYMLGRFPWLLEVDATMPSYLHRLARHMLSKITEEYSPLQDRDGLADTKEQLVDVPAKPNGAMRFSQRPPKKTTRWLNIDQVDLKEGLEYRYYFSGWADTVPVCQTVDDVVSLCNTFLGLLGAKVGQDAELICTLLRVAHGSLTQDDSDANRDKWLDLLKRVLIPALSMSKQNPQASQQVFDILMLFPKATRYNVYSEWFKGKTSRLGDVDAAFRLNRHEVKNVVQRISGESAKKQALNLAKLSFSSPGVVTMYIIKTLETYSNMVPHIVETTRHLSALGWDVLTWCIINSLGGAGRDRQQADGMLTSPWLSALSRYTALSFGRYTHMDPTPVLQYLAFEFRAGDTTDLELLKQILIEMAGIGLDVDFNEEDTHLMAGGDFMQSMILQRLGDSRHAKKSSAKRLAAALTSSKLTGQILISIAQARQAYPYQEASSTMPLKVLGNNMDEIHKVLAQYLEVVNATHTPAEFEDAVPDVVSLIGDCGLDPAMAFTICKASIAHRMHEADKVQYDKVQAEKARRRRASSEKMPVDADAEMVDADGKPATSTEAASEAQIKEELALDDTEAKLVVRNGEDDSPPQPRISPSPWNSALEALYEPLIAVTGDLSSRVSIPFFVTFWSHSSADIVNLGKDHLDEMNKFQDKLKKERVGYRAKAGMHEKERKMEALQSTIEGLRSDIAPLVGIYAKVDRRLKSGESDSWFSWPVDREELDTRHIQLLQECFLPRAMLSPLDSRYSFLMLKAMHERGTTGFSIMNILSQLFRKREMAALISQCTELEAKHLALFLNEVLKLLASWHADKGSYEKHAIGAPSKLPGFLQPYAEGDADVYLEYETYRRLLTNWHSALNAALQACFDSDEYTRRRNAIIVLRAIHQTWPVINFMGKNMLAKVKDIGEKEERQDLKVMANSLAAHLARREKFWVLPQSFRLTDTSKELKGGRVSSATPQPGATTPKLNATAPEFRPSPSTAQTNAGKESVAGPEDGEVSDEVKPKAPADTEMTDVSTVTSGAAKVEEEKKKPIDDPDNITLAPADSKFKADAEQSSRGTPVRPPTTNGQHRQGVDRSMSSAAPLRGPPPYGPPSRLDSRGPASSRNSLPSTPVQRSSFPHRPEDSHGRLNHDYRSAPRDQSPGRLTGRPASPSRTGQMRDDRSLQRPGREEGWPAKGREGVAAAPYSRLQPGDDRGAVNGIPVAARPPHRTSGQSATAAPAPSPSHPHGTGVDSTDASGGAGFSENPERLRLMKEQDERDARAQNTGPARPYYVPNGRGHAPDPSRVPHGWPEAHGEAAPTGPRRMGGREVVLPNQQESSYGRLNAPQESPSAPRAPVGPASGGRGGRFTNHQAPLPNARVNEVAAGPPPNARPPETPPAFRTEQRRGGNQFERPVPVSQPTTPMAESVSVHPDRLAAIQTNDPAASGSRSAASSPSAPPLGPRATRAPQGAPTGPSDVSNGPPAGPALDRTRSNRQRASINATLQQTMGPNGNLSFRGASSRQGNVTGTAPNTPGAPSVGSPMEPPNSRSSARQDEPFSRPASRNEGHPDYFQRDMGNNPNVDHSRTRPREEEHLDQQQGSRNASRERRPENMPHKRFPPSAAHDENRNRLSGGPLPRNDDRRLRDDREFYDGPPRDRRTGPGPGPERPRGMDDGQPHRPTDGQGYFQQNSGAGPDWHEGRGGRHITRGGRDGGRGDGFRGGRGGYGGGAGRGDDRRESGGGMERRGPPMRDDGGLRKRMHEDGGVGGPMDGAKRRRGGGRGN
nr:tho complex subunit 2 [Quercus suber]